MRAVTRRISAWAGPVIGIAAVLCAAIVVAYASGTRVVISIPAAADIGGPTPTGSSDATPAPLNSSALTLVHPTHPVEVLDGPESSTEIEGQPAQADDATATASPGTPAATEGDEVEVAAPDAAPAKPALPIATPAPVATPAPSAQPTQATDTEADDNPTHSPRPTSSGWRPTVTPSPSPSWSHSHHDDSEDDGTGGASQPTP